MTLAGTEVAGLCPVAPDPRWAPRYFTPRAHRVTDGEDVVAFSDAFMHLPTDSIGHRAGEPLRLSAWQRWVIGGALEVTPDGRRAKNRAIIGVARRAGKSLTTSAIGLYGLVTAQHNDLIVAAAGDRQQARIIHDAAKWQVQRSPELSQVLKVYRDAIEYPARNAVWRVVSADSRLMHGFGPAIICFDEVHVQRSDDLWAALTTSGAAREEQLIVAISTAGDSLDSLLGGLYTHGVRVSTGEVEDPELFFAWWEPHDPSSDLLDEKALRQANPAYADGLINLSAVRSASRTLAPAQFRRFYRNEWSANTGEDHLVTAVVWDQARTTGALAKGDHVVLAFDGSVGGDNADSTVLIAQRVDDGLLQVLGLWESEGAGSEWRVPREEVDAAVHAAFRDYKVVQLGCDPAFWHSETAEWASRYGSKTVIEFPMSNSRMGPATTQFIADVQEGRCCHAGDPRLRRHILNTRTKDSAYGLVPRKDRPGSARKIDAAVAAIMVNQLRGRATRRRSRAGGM